MENSISSLQTSIGKQLEEAKALVDRLNSELVQASGESTVVASPSSLAGGDEASSTPNSQESQSSQPAQTQPKEPTDESREAIIREINDYLRSHTRQPASTPPASPPVSEPVQPDQPASPTQSGPNAAGLDPLYSSIPPVTTQTPPAQQPAQVPAQPPASQTVTPPQIPPVQIPQIEEHKEPVIPPTIPTDNFGQGVQSHGELMDNTPKAGTPFTPIIVMLILAVMAAQYVRTHYFQREAPVKGSVADKLLGGMNHGSGMGSSQEMQEYQYRERRSGGKKSGDKEKKKKPSKPSSKKMDKDDDTFDKV